MSEAKRRPTVVFGRQARYIVAGLLAVLMACPALAQAVGGLAAAPAPGPLSNPAPQPASSSSSAASPEQPAPPFGAAPEVFPTLSPTPAPTSGQATSPFGAAPGVFPTLSPAPSPTSGQVTLPFGTAPRVSPTTSPAPSSEQPPVAAAAEVSRTPSGTLGPIGAMPSVFAPALGLVPAVTSPLVTPWSGYGFPSASAIGATGVALAAPPQPPSSVGLQPLQPGAIPIQAGNIRAPPILIVPSVSLYEGYTDNPRNTPQMLSDSLTQFGAGTAISVDSVRLQGQLNGQINYYKYARATDQDKLNLDLLGYGLGTIIPEHVFIDGRAAITQLSRTGGIGFSSPSLIPSSQQTQTEAISLSPIVRESINGYVDSELRYTYGANLFQNGSLLSNSVPVSPLLSPTSLSNITQNDMTLSVATGRRFVFFGSKLTLDANKIDSQSPARSTQLRAFDDVEYQFSRQFAALARFGFEDLRYPLQPAAITIGPIWLIGGRFAPFPGSYVVARYGLQDGFYGADGALRYQVTPNTAILALLQRNLSSSQEQILANLNASQVDAYGNVVNQIGLPSALANPEFAYATTSIYREEQARVGIQTALYRNTFGVFGFLDHRKPLGNLSGVSGLARTLSSSDTVTGINLNWSRSLTPRLTGGAQLGYATAVAAHQRTLTADLRLTYALSDRFNAVLDYQLLNVDNHIANGSYRRDLVEIGLTRSF